VRATVLATLALLCAALAGAPSAVASGPPAHGPTVAGHIGVIRRGVAYAPSAAPLVVKQVIWAGNRIRTRPYVWGGGHMSFRARGYDCSGSVSFALHGAGLLDSPLDSTAFMRWGRPGRGHWITVYAKHGHAWMTVAGMRFDTSGSGRSRWRVESRSPDHFRLRHPVGL
jgi:hypothetical protein